MSEPKLGRKPTGASMTIIEALLPHCQIPLGRWSLYLLAVTCGCRAGLFHEALHEVYILRIQRGNALFTANVLGARGALLSVLVHFFEHGRWGSLVETDVEGQTLTAEDQLCILVHAALFLTSTRGFGSARGANLLRAR